jgi:hypothetical protein
MSTPNPRTNVFVDDSASRMSAGEYLEIARIHNREARKLLERAQAAHASDQRHEAMLLTDLSIAQRERAEQYEKAARGEGQDPIVAEILDGLKRLRSSFIPAPGQLLGLREYSPGGRFTRAAAWLSRQ